MAAASDNLSIGYGEARIQAKGLTGILGALFLTTFCIAFYIHTTTNMERRKEHQSVMDELRVITYILSQPENKRPALAMPKALRDRLTKPYYGE